MGGASAVTLATALLAGVLAGSGTSTASEPSAGSGTRTTGAADERGTGSAAGAGSAASGARVGADQVRMVYERFAPPRAINPPRAFTYDRRRVPAGAGIRVLQRAGDGKTTVRVAVHGLAPRYRFGVHVHTKPCGLRPNDSGPHYQNVKDPKQPSTNPRYANPRNEVWLDFTTDAKGNGGAVSRHDWTFRRGEARSVVLHERGTHTGPGHAGQAGDRLACVSVPFAGSKKGD
ncbi:superoxide dismutase family protein [Streptomyces iconiensis]|uniref:Superoxide dismutase family protein n=1 Tax=Streptomyces iconiensis TaxID=1384038 RepID=A0ABT6ZNL4_9ACTN|nr:superoxide dismutase family protein [Streptomyces iconiensis]MDJ1130651.1 superoxide dismutase family protein [Streptomyces iconiensis]